jgi:hypothetical protein
MEDFKIKNWLAFICFILIIGCLWSKPLAEERVIILEHSVKPVGIVSSGRFVETAWEVKLSNKEEKPLELIIRISFMDKDEEPLEETEKRCKIKAKETKTCSGTPLLPKSVAQQVASTRISVRID